MDRGLVGCLKIVPLGRLLPHEGCEARRVERLARRLREDGVLRNPPLVTEVESGYVILDGVTRVAALALLGLPHVSVQLVDYRSQAVALEAWHHLVVGLEPYHLREEMGGVEGVDILPTNVEEARRLLEGREVLCYVIFSQEHVQAIKGPRDLEGQASLLQRVVDTYQGRGEVRRLADSTSEEAFRGYHGRAALVAFPRYRPSEIIHLASNQARLPAGITRFLISGRVLHLNISLELLGADITLEEKNDRLRRLVEGRVDSGAVRLYHEPVYLLDD